TYPILPPHQGGAMWFYSLPMHAALCLPAARLYRDVAAGVKHGNIFSLDVGPDPAGRLRKVDVETLRRVGGMIRNPPKPEPPPISEGKAASASSVWPDPGYEAAMAFDGNENTRWGAAADARSGWLQVDLGRETEIGRAVVMEIGYPRTRQFAIEVEEAGSWRAVVTGDALGGERSFDFAPVRTRRVRLNILKASEVPTIEEFRVYAPAAPGGKR
ncbi:MAG: discoidin domain-containing protein, partial [Armatimonadetes bacterium]|nr:discoidin domain-containing protein [Armatimonadota bacterium]